MTLGKYDAAISPSFIDGLTLEGNLGHTGKYGILTSAFLDVLCIKNHEVV